MHAIVSACVRSMQYRITFIEGITMKISSRILALVIGAIFSASLLSATEDESTGATDMEPMHQSGHMMMNPQMMQQMMSHGQHQNMPMMGPQAMHQMMHQMHQMPQMGYGHGTGFGMPMMGHGMGGMMMNPQTSHMPMQHMQKMEQHLAKIESLLTQILEAQKAQ